MYFWMVSLLTLPAVLAKYEATPEGWQTLQVLVLFPKLSRSSALAFLHDVGRCIDGPSSQEQVDMVWLDS